MKEDFRQKITEKAMSDSEFKSRLMQDPKAAIAEVTGKNIPAEVKIHVIEEDSNVLNLIVPKKSVDELSDDDLDQVAGGGIIDIWNW
ncbi:NHLP leader peptide family RiPP precursor [bacterium]|nr:NHLP leader peptide family RiPP precursor [bacterium]